jgi:hypothetical protein
MIPLDRRTAFAHLSPWLAVALQQRLLTTASPGSLPGSRSAARSDVRRQAEPR